MIDTRQNLMQTLLHHKETGLTIDELSENLSITRNAVQQHITALERDGLVIVKGQRSTKGRPSRTYVLSEKGYESFPRNYALLAQQMLETARDTLGEDAVETLLSHMADDLASDLKPQLNTLNEAERLTAVVDIMNSLGYQASALQNKQGIAAVNCIYHKLAAQTRAICRYDVNLISQLTGKTIDHTCCMADGDSTCTFELREPKTTPPPLE